ncbi:MAG: threonine/serine exporter family protein [Bacillota bacterium]
MAFKMLLAFTLSLFTGVTLHVPVHTWLAVGVTGTLGWVVNAVLLDRELPGVIAAAGGAMVVGLSAEILARIQKEPATVYIVAGIIPLVPGVIAYNAMLGFLENRYNRGLALGFEAFLIAAYIAAGLAVVSVVVNYLTKILRRTYRK